MTIKRSSLTIFFIALTISIGLVSVNLPLSSYAQNNALGQDGNGDAEQDTIQSQSSTQNGQAVSGESSILSGNNILCQDQDNSEVGQGLCSDTVGTIPSEGGVATLTITTVLRANCQPSGPPCPVPDGRVIILFDGRPYQQYDPVTRVAGGTTERTIPLPIGAPYGIVAQGVNGGIFFNYELGNIQGDCSGRDRCNAVMGPNGANVIVNFHYCRVPC